MVSAKTLSAAALPASQMSPLSPIARAPDVSDFEAQRAQRIAENKARLAALGINESSQVINVAMKAKKLQAKRMKKAEEAKASEPVRKSRRLQGTAPEFGKLVEDDIFLDEDTGLIQLPKLGSEDTDKMENFEKIRTSNTGTRSNIYDKEVGITCHFCRQKTLCKEPDCPRCSKRDLNESCIGKSECTKCRSATGQFCRSCLRLRYGMELEDVKKEMAAGTWLCAHCYEEEHPDANWICNSSICMTRRGLKPTGIAIHTARELGFVSVAHMVQAQLQKHKKASS